MTTEEIKKRIEHIPRLSGEEHLNMLLGFVAQFPGAATYCEIGTYYGSLTAAMALANPEATVIMIDHMLGGICDFPEGVKCTYLDVRTNLIKAGVWERVLPMPLKSRLAMPMMKLIHPVIDLLFLDGDHNYDNVLFELHEYGAFVPVGGIICGDDCNTLGGISFPEAWEKMGKEPVLEGGGAAQAVVEFFRGNDRFELIAGTPNSTFAFRRVK
jgi:predicted O-methyltransferase YrrM